MKHLALIALILGLGFSTQVFATEKTTHPTDEVCPCGVDEDGACVPCNPDGE